MAIFNRRLIFWLIKAYLKRWGKVIFISFLIGLGIFFVVKQFLFSSIVALMTHNKETIGVVGAYTQATLPSDILSNLSEGLTTIDEHGNIHPGLAKYWTTNDGGKTYTFTLKRGVTFTDGTPFTSKEVSYAYSDVKIDRPDPTHIIFHLKESYAPFLVNLSKPLFRKNFVGVGPYILSAMKLNGSFVESIAIRNSSGSTVKIYQFYPTQDALKLGFMLGEVSTAQGLSDLTFKNTTFAKYSNVTIEKALRHDLLVTLFYNTQDKNLSDRKLRDALSYQIPNTFEQGERAYTPISPLSWAYSSVNEHRQDSAHAAVLLDAAGGTKNLPTFTLSTLSKYESVAKIIQKEWGKIGIKTKIVVVETIPDKFEMFLGDFIVSPDPDQYSLWHSFQSNNITNFNDDKRIDKLLEDGRQTVDMSERTKIYADFQKYLTDEQPATFLYFPNNYTIKRK